MKKSYTLIFLYLITQNLLGQSQHFPLTLEPSQFTGVQQVVGLDTIKLEYSRPNMKGRVFFGKIVPWNSVWRTGANASTKIELSEKMTINGNEIPKGKYSLLTIPNEDEWTVILNKNTTLWGHYGYNEEEDFLRFKVKPLESKEYLETFDLVFKNTTKDRTDLEISWGNIRIPLRIEANKKSVDDRIMASIHEKLNDPKAHEESIVSAHVYFFAALYYQESGRDLKQALEWLIKGIKIHNVNYFHYYKSEMLGEMEKYTEAIMASKVGQEIFNKGTNVEWKLKHKEQIENWKLKMEEL